MLKSLSFDVEVFPSTETFLRSQVISKTDCLILGVGMSGMSGLDPQRALLARRHDIPIIFITSCSDEEELHSQSMAVGPVVWLPMPFEEQSLLNAIDFALSAKSIKRNEREDLPEKRDSVM